MRTGHTDRPDRNPAEIDSSDTRPIFLCYRQIDGKRHARWVFSALRETLEAIGEISEVYFDQTAPAITDWQALHGPSLERARALVVICTPGLYADQGPDDWVHRELNWWLNNRSVAPVIVDATGEGMRWIPEKLKDRWPNPQRVNLDPNLFDGFSEEEITMVKGQVAHQILGGATISESKVIYQDLEKVRRLNRWLWFSAVALSILAVGLIVATLFATNQTKLANTNRLKAEFRRNFAEQVQEQMAQTQERLQGITDSFINVFPKPENLELEDLEEIDHMLEDTLSLTEHLLVGKPVIFAAFSERAAESWLRAGIAGKFAKEVLQEAVEIRIDTSGTGAPETIYAKKLLARAHANIGETDQALSITRKVLAVVRSQADPNRTYVADAAVDLALLLIEQSQPNDETCDEIQRLIQEAITIEKRVFGKETERTLSAKKDLKSCTST